MEGKDNTGEIVLDPSAGISLEEQREILEEINAIGAKASFPPPQGFSASKRGLAFPLWVNLGAILLLGCSLLALRVFHNQETVAIRENASPLGLTERRLIQEIRRETATRMAEKEAEIAAILSMLSDLDTEYQALQIESETENNQATRQHFESLQALQTEYQNTLTILNSERAQILEDSRVREADLYAQAEAQAEELEEAVAQSRAELASARDELQRLAAEQETVAQIEAQLGGLYAVASAQIQDSRYESASDTLATITAFLNTPRFQRLRSFQSRIEVYRAAVQNMEELIRSGLALQRDLEAARNAVSMASDVVAGLTIESYAEAVNQAAEYERTIAALRREVADLEQAGGAASRERDQGTQRLTDLERSLETLRGQAASLESALQERDGAISALRSENAATEQQLQRQIAANEELMDQNETLNLSNEELRRNIEAIRLLLQAE